MTQTSESTPSDNAFPHHALLLAATMLGTLILRVILLFTSQRFLQSDEALVGMIALDILDGKGIPVFPYGNAYGGGHIIEALLMVPLFRIFGPSDVLVSAVPALESCAYVAIVYFAMRDWLGSRAALLGAALFSFSAPFVAYSFYVNGSMTTGALAWAGLAFYFRSCARDKHSSPLLFISGICLGLAYYSFDYALFYLLALLMMESFRGWRRLFDGWRCFASFYSGFVLGASPLILFNFAHNFDNLKNLTSRTLSPARADVPGFATRLFRTIIHDLPSFFGVSIYDFADSISPISWIAYAVVVISLVCVFWRARGAIAESCRGIISREPRAFSRQHRVASILFMTLLYFVIYTASSAAGQTPRYLIPFFPLLPLILAVFVLDLSRVSRNLAIAFASLYLATQFIFVISLARDTRTTEWKIATEGRDIARVAAFLEERDLTTVLAPYEIKWKLMFATNRRIVCAAYLFGYDRETDYNKEVVDRVNRRGVIPAIVLDKELKFADVAKNFNPHASFDIQTFFARLDSVGVLYQKETIGDYVVFHGFTRPFAIPDPYTSPTAP